VRRRRIEFIEFGASLDGSSDERIDDLEPGRVKGLDLLRKHEALLGYTAKKGRKTGSFVNESARLLAFLLPRVNAATGFAACMLGSDE
jgi:hypothetical protein